MGGTIFGQGILGLREKLTSVGFDWAGLELTLGLDPSCDYGTEQYVSLVGFAKYHEKAAEILNDDALGLRISSASPVGQTSVFDYIALAAPTIGQAFDNWVRFQTIPSPSIKVSRHSEDGVDYLQWEIPDAVGPKAQLAGVILGIAADRWRRMLGDTSFEFYAEVPHKVPRGVDAYRKIVGPNIVFDAKHLRLGLAREHLARVPVGRESYLFGIMERAALHMLQEQTHQNDKVFQISGVISSCLKQGDPSLEGVAANLGMSRRSLQRILESAGTSFRTLLDDVRRSLATRYLKESDMQLSEIAYLLGYSELSAFSRAAKVWFGMTPLQFRQSSAERVAESVIAKLSPSTQFR